jgi:hypothetical protein
MQIENPIRFLPKGSSQPFLALDEWGHKVVIKALLDPTMNKTLLNEYLAGNLAVSIGLPWPKTRLAVLGSTTTDFLHQNSFTPSSPDCVAIDFVENLKPVPWPDPPEGQPRWEETNLNLLPEANRRHMNLHFDNPERQRAFYGKALFEAWLFMQDTKYDTLFALPDHTPFFLDGSFAFAGPEWRYEEMDYSRQQSLPKSGYLEGILTDSAMFNEWFERIDSLADSYVESLIQAIPLSWQIPSQGSDFLLRLLTIKREQFTTSCKGWIRHQEFMREWLRKNKQQ